MTDINTGGNKKKKTDSGLENELAGMRKILTQMYKLQLNQSQQVQEQEKRSKEEIHLAEIEKAAKQQAKDFADYQKEVRKINEEAEEKSKEEREKTFKLLRESFIPKNTRTMMGSTLIGGALGIDPAIIQALGIVDGYRSIRDHFNESSKRKEKTQKKLNEVNEEYGIVSGKSTTKKSKLTEGLNNKSKAASSKTDSATEENEKQSAYEKAMNKMKSFLSDRLATKKERDEEKKERKGFFGKVLGFAGSVLKILGLVALVAIAIRGIAMAYNGIKSAIENSLLGRGYSYIKNLLGFGKDNGEEESAGEVIQKANEGRMGVGAGLVAAGNKEIKLADNMTKINNINAELDAQGLTPQQRMKAVMQNEELAAASKNLAKSNRYGNRGLYGASNWLKNTKVGGFIGKSANWLGNAIGPGLTNVGGKVLKWGGKALGKAAIPLQLLMGGLEAGNAFAKGDNRSGYQALGGTAGGIGGALGGAAAGAAIGSVIPIVGTAIGGILGGVLGAFGGDWLGRKATGAGYDLINGQPKTEVLTTDQTLTKAKELEENQKNLELMNSLNAYQETSIDLLKDINKTGEECKKQDGDYYQQSLAKETKIDRSSYNMTSTARTRAADIVNKTLVGGW